LKGEIIANEVALEVMRSFATESNPQVQQQKLRIEEMKRQLGQVEYGAGMELPVGRGGSSDSRRAFQVPFPKVPELGTELARLVRDVKVQETVYTLLTQQYEQAKIAEARDTPVVQVLDKAVPAERKSRPRPFLNTAIAGTLSLFVAIFLAFFLEYLERMRVRERRTD
jgi:capsule polysaccharide export protein KpsE/RkpR